ncbi:hypothetical protein SASPL_120983 [Salvia splendens]|uniref:DUF4216 domain-containing protein n=1 Tax=Salvia splendens TaxID=180675 RepID=A0A8X8XRS3_SALSN|nr:hypothetical protein SASPL_120983 [Salvia splendens]
MCGIGANLKFNRSLRNETVNDNARNGVDVFTITGRSLGKGDAMRLDVATLTKAHQYVLFNSEAVPPYIEKHRAIVEQSNPRVGRHQLERNHSETFADWFAQHVETLTIHGENPTLKDLKLLSRRPNFIGVKYKKYIVHGFRFHTKDLESTKKTQNCGVRVKATTSSFSSTRDQNPILSELDYYGILTDIIQLDYGRGRGVVLYDCEWVSKGKRLRTDADGFTLANFSNMTRHDEPFILASQAEQVFYVEDPTDSQWRVVVSTTARANYHMEPIIDVDTYLQSNICVPPDSVDADDFGWVRDDVDGIEDDIRIRAEDIRAEVKENLDLDAIFLELHGKVKKRKQIPGAGSATKLYFPSATSAYASVRSTGSDPSKMDELIEQQLEERLQEEHEKMHVELNEKVRKIEEESDRKMEMMKEQMKEQMKILISEKFGEL